MLLQLNFKTVILLSFGILFITEVILCYPAATPEDFLSHGLNHLTKTAKSVTPNLGFNRLLFSFSDLQSRNRNVRNVDTERNIAKYICILGLDKNNLYPWQIKSYNVEKTKDEEPNKLNEEQINAQKNTFMQQNNGNLSFVTSKNVRNKQATEFPENNGHVIAISDIDFNDDNESEPLISSEITTEFMTEFTTEFTTNSTETTTEEEVEGISDRMASPQLVATLLG